MEKTWTGTEKKDTKMIVLKNDMIYFGNPKEAEIENIISDLKYKTSPTNLFSLPLSYIIQIRWNEQTDVVDIFHKGKAHDQLIISDLIKKNELFEALRTVHSRVKYTVDKPTIFHQSKKPLIAFVILVLLYVWTLFLANEIAHGANYEIVGNPGLAGIALGLAYLGLVKVTCIFLPLIIIALVAVIRKMRKPAVFHVLSFK